jgi:hypothetical protein
MIGKPLEGLPYLGFFIYVRNLGMTGKGTQHRTNKRKG